MTYQPVSAAEYRLPEDELIRKPFQVPPRWDADVSPCKQRKPGQGGRKGKGDGARVRVESALQKKPWQTLKELVELLNFHEKTITEVVRLGFGAGRLARRQRKGREFEYAVL